MSLQRSGGIEIVAGKLARELARIGYRISWAATGESCPNEAWQDIPLRAWNGTEAAFGVPLPIPSPKAAEKLAESCESADAIIVASEPLTRDTSSWIELPEYGALFAEIRDGRPRVAVRILD